MLRPSLVLLSALLLQQEPTEKERRDYVEKNIDKAIEKGLRALRELQRPSGCFESTLHGRTVRGTTALALYTFLASGKTLDDPSAAKALDWLLTNPIDWTGSGQWDTYEFSLVAVALSYSIPHLPKGARRDRATALLQRAADWLVGAQVPGGGWSYNLRTIGIRINNWHDHSNSQFAVLGLRAAANAGAKVAKEVWEREATHYKTSQLGDGGWGYRACYKDQARSAGSTSTMTAAGVMGLAMALGSTHPSGAEQVSKDPAIKKGLEAMRVHWQLGLESKLKPLGGVPYLLYSVERACMVTGQQRLGDIDWYVEGAWHLISRQQGDGLLVESPDPVPGHCFSLLFLKRAFVPVATPSRHTPETATPKPRSASETSGGAPREME
jgi:hypothetical protein